MAGATGPFPPDATHRNPSADVPLATFAVLALPLPLASAFQQVSTEGELDAGDAVTLLMLSGLDPQTDLRTIWDFADPETEGYLTKEGFFLSLRCA